MSMLRRLLPGHRDRELEDELRFDQEHRIEQKIRQGMSEAVARRTVRLEFGGIDQVKEQCRDERSFEHVRSVLRDIHYSLRLMRRSPGYTISAIAILAVGIGLNAAVFTIANAILFRGFPLVERNDRLLYMTSFEGCCVSWPDYMDWRTQARSFQDMALVHGVDVSMTGADGYARKYDASEVTANTFRLVGVRPIEGRDFTHEDELSGSAPVAILSYGFWQNRFGGDRGIIGRSIRLQGAATTVIGVMPRRFSFPQKQDLWIPLVATAEVRKRENRFTWMAVGRLADGISVQQARTEMSTIGRRLELTYPVDKGFPPHVYNFHEFYIGPRATAMYEAMLGAVALVVLIACANLSNLLLARASRRSREIALRIALGAGRGRLVRQVMIESLILAAIGGFAGLSLAEFAVRMWSLFVNGPLISDTINGNWFDQVLSYSMDAGTFGYIALLSVATAVIFGLAPAANMTRVHISEALKDGAHGASAAGHARRTAALLVALEVALALTLLAGAGVMIRSFLRLYEADAGINAEHVLLSSVSLPAIKYRNEEQRLVFYDALKTRFEHVPGVEAVAFSDTLPVYGTRPRGVEMSEIPASDPEHHSQAGTLEVSEDYFRALGARLIAGRDFSRSDTQSGPAVAIVNEQFARKYASRAGVIGKRVRLFRGNSAGPWLTVVGVVSDISQDDTTRQEFRPLVYVSWGQQSDSFAWIFSRTNVPPGELAGAFRRELHAIDPSLAMGTEAFPLSERLNKFYGFRAVTAGLFICFGVVALLLAGTGLYAVVSHSVGERTREIGIRIAIGADTGDLLGLIFRQEMTPVAVGLAIGIVGSIVLNSLIRSLLVGTVPADPAVLLFASVTLIASAALACWIPARRATRIDPTKALRQE